MNRTRAVVDRGFLGRGCDARCNRGGNHCGRVFVSRLEEGHVLAGFLLLVATGNCSGEIRRGAGRGTSQC